MSKSVGCEQVGYQLTEVECELSKVDSELVDEEKRKRRKEFRSLNNGRQDKGGVSRRIDFRYSWIVGKVEVKGDLVQSSRREGFTLVSALTNSVRFGVTQHDTRSRDVTR